VRFTVPAQAETLPMPAAQDFIYYTPKAIASFGTAAGRKAARQHLVTASKLGPKPGPLKILGLPKDTGAAPRPRPIGHQFTVPKPTASASDVLKAGLIR
jgi:hypothetical protein